MLHKKKIFFKFCDITCTKYSRNCTSHNQSSYLLVKLDNFHSFCKLKITIHIYFYPEWIQTQKLTVILQIINMSVWKWPSHLIFKKIKDNETLFTIKIFSFRHHTFYLNVLTTFQKIHILRSPSASLLCSP